MFQSNNHSIALLEDKIQSEKTNNAQILRYSCNSCNSCNSFSSFLHLPTEIIAEICSTVLESISDTRVSPLFLGKICRRIREVVWTTPKLWRNVRLSLVHWMKLKIIVGILEEWLLRAGGYPLSIRVAFKGNENQWTLDPPLAVMAVLAAHSEKWQSVELFLPDNDAYFDILDRVRSRLPQLTTLAIHPISPITWDRRKGMKTFQVAPLLRNLTLANYYDFDNSFPWGGLTRLTCIGWTLSECMDVLAHTPNLEECYIDQVLESHQQGSPIFLPSLQLLEILDAEEWVASEFIRTLTTPSLHTLKLFPFHVSGHTLFDDITSLTKRSSCEIHRLAVGSIFNPNNGRIVCEEQNMLKFLEALPSLVQLYLNAWGLGSDTCISDRFIDMLHGSCIDAYSSMGDLLPNLEVFQYKGRVAFTDYGFEDMVTCRWHRGRNSNDKTDHAHRLRYIAIEAIGGLEIREDVAKRLLDLVDEGLKISLKIGDETTCFQ